MELQLYTHRDGSILVRSSDTDINCLDEATIEAAGEGPEAVRRAVHTAHAIGFETIVLRQSETFSHPYGEGGPVDSSRSHRSEHSYRD